MKKKKKKKKQLPSNKCIKNDEELLFKGSLQPTAYGDLLRACHACLPDTKKAHCCFAILGIPYDIYYCSRFETSAMNEEGTPRRNHNKLLKDCTFIVYDCLPMTQSVTGPTK
jgi:hypothetical protein